jgi:hypothetical protein
MTRIIEPGSRGGGAGLKGVAYLAVGNLQDSPSIAALQAQNVIGAASHFRRAPARRGPVLKVRINVRAGASPHGRSREFSLTVGALDRLLDIAARSERRGGE